MRNLESKVYSGVSWLFQEELFRVSHNTDHIAAARERVHDPLTDMLGGQVQELVVEELFSDY